MNGKKFKLQKFKINKMEKNNIESPWTIQDAKDGDVVCYDDGWTCIFKRIHGIWYSSYCFITGDEEFHTGYEEHAVDSTINGNAHLATKEQSNLLFQKIKEAGYKWDDETKTLEKLIEPKFKVGDRIIHKESGVYCNIGEYVESFKGYNTNIGGLVIRYDDIDNWELYPLPNKFDITTFKPFDKVLMRSSNEREWTATLYSHYNNNKFYGCGMCCDQCIPYEPNEHLRGTTNDCDNYYKTWK